MGNDIRVCQKISSGRFCAVVLLVFVSGGLCAGAGQGLTRGIPDPGIIKSRQDGWYYIFSTGRGIPVNRSNDLINWERAGVRNTAATEGPARLLPAASFREHQDPASRDLGVAALHGLHVQAGTRHRRAHRGTQRSEKAREGEEASHG